MDKASILIAAETGNFQVLEECVQRENEKIRTQTNGSIESDIDQEVECTADLATEGLIIQNGDYSENSVLYSKSKKN